MEAIIKNLGTEIYSLNNHKGFIIEFKLIQPLIKKWEGNRDPDITRISDMLECINSGGYIPPFIHLAEIKDFGLVCYDGNHRRKVFSKCNCENIKCIIDVIFNASTHDISKCFCDINKLINVPQIYTNIIEVQDIQSNIIDPNSKILEIIEKEINDERTVIKDKVKEDIMELADKFVKKYKQFVSPSKQCFSPNFNRDIFIDNIYDIYKSFDEKVSIKEIKKLLFKLNEDYYSQNRLCRDHTKYKKSVIDKCEKHNFFLFLERIIPTEHVIYVYEHL